MKTFWQTSENSTSVSKRIRLNKTMVGTDSVEIGIPTVDTEAIPTSRPPRQPEVHQDMERPPLPEQVQAQRITVRSMLNITVLIPMLPMAVIRIMSPTTITTSRWPSSNSNSSRRKNPLSPLHRRHPVKLLPLPLELERLELDLLRLLRLGVDTVL